MRNARFGGLSFTPVSQIPLPPFPPLCYRLAMNGILASTLGIFFIFFCTSLGSSFVFFFSKKKANPFWNQIFLGFAAGVMLSASVFSLILPSLNAEVSYMPSVLVSGIAVLLGAGFLFLIDKLVPHFHPSVSESEGLPGKGMGKTGKMFLAVTIHNVPEGLSVGIAFGSVLSQVGLDSPWTSYLGAAMLAIGIGIQNIPEGAVVSLPFQAETQSTRKAFLYGMGSGAVEPVAAVVGLLLSYWLSFLMPWALSFAAGSMLYVIAEEMIPSFDKGSLHHEGVWSFLAGFVLMMALDVAFG